MTQFKLLALLVPLLPLASLDRYTADCPQIDRQQERTILGDATRARRLYPNLFEEPPCYYCLSFNAGPPLRDFYSMPFGRRNQEAYKALVQAMAFQLDRLSDEQRFNLRSFHTDDDTWVSPEYPLMMLSVLEALADGIIDERLDSDVRCVALTKLNVASDFGLSLQQVEKLERYGSKSSGVALRVRDFLLLHRQDIEQLRSRKDTNSVEWTVLLVVSNGRKDTYLLPLGSFHGLTEGATLEVRRPDSSAVFARLVLKSLNKYSALAHASTGQRELYRHTLEGEVVKLKVVE